LSAHWGEQARPLLSTEVVKSPSDGGALEFTVAPELMP